MPWFSMPALGQRAAIASRVAAVALVVVAFEMVISRVDEGAGPGRADEAAAPRAASDRSAVCERHAGGGILVLLTASRVLPQERVLEADVAICSVQRTRQDLLTTDRDRVAAGGALRAELTDHPVTLLIRGIDQVGEATVNTTMGALFASDRSSVIRLESVDVPLDGRPDKYPFDWFAFYGYGELVFAPGITVPRSIKGDDEDPDPAVLSVELELLSSPGVGEFDLHARQAERPVGLGFGGPGLIFSLERRALTRRFVVVMLLVPVLYVVLFALLLAQRQHQVKSSLRDLLLGMVAATVALLPLRQVLVPEDVPGLTVVDWWLGSTILLFVAISLWAFPVAIGAIAPSTPAAAAPRPAIVSISLGAAWTLLLLFAAINVPVVLLTDDGYAPTGAIGRVGLAIVAVTMLVGAFVSGRTAFRDREQARPFLRDLTTTGRAGLALGAAAAALVLFFVAWFLVINLGWALGGGSPYG